MSALGKLLKRAEPFRNAILADGQAMIQLKPLLRGNYNSSDNDDVCDWIAPVRWEIKVPKKEAVKRLLSRA